jgi:hypothetical protein
VSSDRSQRKIPFLPAAKLAELETRIESHDENTTALFEAIRRLMEPPARPRKPFGFAGQSKA